MGSGPGGGRGGDQEGTTMQLTLTDTEATELRDLLDGALGDLSSEIADTDNPGYRLGLKERRTHLQALRAGLVEVGEPVA